MESILRDIGDTARWVAVFRAEESERRDAVFRDPYARRLAGERGEQIASAIEFGRTNSWSFVARTYLFDAAIERHVAEGFDTILNLGAGLDTRPYCSSGLRAAFLNEGVSAISCRRRPCATAPVLAAA